MDTTHVKLLGSRAASWSLRWQPRAFPSIIDTGQSTTLLIRRKHFLTLCIINCWSRMQDMYVQYHPSLLEKFCASRRSTSTSIRCLCFYSLPCIHQLHSNKRLRPWKFCQQESAKSLWVVYCWMFSPPTMFLLFGIEQLSETCQLEKGKQTQVLSLCLRLQPAL